MPPIVAITSPLRRDERALRVRLAVSYARAVEAAGGLPVVVPPLQHPGHAAQMIESADALLLTGGEDVDPARYGAARHDTVTDVSAERDATELALVAAAYAQGKPLLAICRGVQLLNVAYGGTLIQDIPSQRPDAIAHDHGDDKRGARVHPVRLDAGSRLADALGAGEISVNSFHHQAPDRVGSPLRATAWAPDGIVEGLEWGGNDWWAVGVQWHPEELDGQWESGLFRRFIDRALRGRGD